MQKDGKYVYCIVATKNECNFGPIGIGGRGDLVHTTGFGELSMVVSDHPLSHFVLNPENIIAHQKVIEAVMCEFDGVIPVKFGTIAATPDEIRNLLDRRYRELYELVQHFENKVEYALKASWCSMEDIFKEIDKECPELKEIKKRIEKSDNKEKRKEYIQEAGEKIEKYLQTKKEDECREIISAFKKTIYSVKENKTIGDAAIMNVALLISKGRETEFDNIMTDIGEKYKERIDFTYTGPLPIFNFIDLRILPEKWEM